MLQPFTDGGVMDFTVVVIGRQPCVTSRGPLAVGEFQRLPTEEAIQLMQQDVVIFGSWQDQYLSDAAMQPDERRCEPDLAAIPALPGQRPKRRYRRRDLRAED